MEAAYPAEEVAARREGSVQLKLTIDGHGVVTNAEVVTAPSPALGEAARAAAMRFTFEPAQRDGTAVPARIMHRYDFHLTGAIDGLITLSTAPGSATPAGIEVSLEASDGTRWSTMVDAAGAYRFEALSAGRYVLTARAPGFVEARGLAPVVAGQTTRGELRLSPVSEVDAAAVPAAAVTPAASAASLEIAVLVRDMSAADQMRQSSEAVKVVETEVAKRESADLGEVLARTPGVGVRRTGGLGSTARFSLNGMSDDQIRFFLDGIPLDFTAASLGLANVPVNLVERVEIYSGVVPVRFGADALGGAVNLVSNPVRRGFHGSAAYQVGSFGTHRVMLGSQYLDAGTGLFSRVSGFLDLAKNDYPIDVEVPNAVGRPEPLSVRRFHDAYRAAGGSAEVGVVGRPWAQRLLLSGFLTNYYDEIQHNAIMAVPYGERTYEETAVGGHARYENDFGDSWRLEAVAGYAHERGRYQNADTCAYDWLGQCVLERGQNSDPSDQRTWQHAVYGRATLRWEPVIGHQLTLSSSPSFVTRTGDERIQNDPAAPDALNAENDLATFVSGLEYRLEALEGDLESTLFAKHYLQLLRSNEPLQSDQQLTWLEQNRDTQRVGWGGGLRLRLVGPLMAKLSYEWATRLPRAEEIFGNIGTLSIANLRIRPETSHNANVGLLAAFPDTQAGTFSTEVLGFIRQADDLIVLLAGDSFQMFDNVFRARAVGVEASARWAAPREWVSIDGNFTYQSFRNISSDGIFGTFEGDRIPNRPWLFANANVRFAAADLLNAGDELSLGGRVRYVREFFRGWESFGAREFKQVVPSYVVASSVLSYLWPLGAGKANVSFEVDNITDALVQDNYGVQRPGRSYWVKMSLTQ